MSISEMVDVAWKTIQETGEPRRGEFRVFETDISALGGRILLAIDSKGMRHLLVPVYNISDVYEDRKSSGVHIIAHELIDNSTRYLFMDIACRKSHLQEIFSTLIAEMLMELKDDPSKPSKTCLLILERWRELLERERSSLLSVERLAGIFAELLYVHEIVRLRPDALDFWVGSTGARHDLSGGNISIEVKSTLARHGRFFEIHGHDQLEPQQDGELYLAAVKLERVTSGGESVPDLLRIISESGADYHRLCNLLYQVGYDINDNDTYDQIRFIVRENILYPVDDSFPKITSASFKSETLPDGIVRLDYQIDLTGQPPYPLSDDEKNDVLLKLTGSETK